MQPDRGRLLSNMDSFETCEIVVPDASRPIIKAAAAPAAAAVPVSTKQPTATAASDCGSGLGLRLRRERDNFRFFSPSEGI